jgi:hypothetical protein
VIGLRRSQHYEPGSSHCSSLAHLPTTVALVRLRRLEKECESVVSHPEHRSSSQPSRTGGRGGQHCRMSFVIGIAQMLLLICSSSWYGVEAGAERLGGGVGISIATSLMLVQSIIGWFFSCL